MNRYLLLPQPRPEGESSAAPPTDPERPGEREGPDAYSALERLVAETESRIGYRGKYISIVELHSPLPLDELQERLPGYAIHPQKTYRTDGASAGGDDDDQKES